MSTNQIVVIKDACVLIDLHDLGLLTAFYKLQVTAVTTGFVLGEIIDNEQSLAVESLVRDCSLRVYNDGDVQAITDLTDKYPALSFADCSVLELSGRIPGIILSSDKSLRNEAKRLNLTVKGLLWVINQLFEQQLMTREACLLKLEEYPKINPRAPLKDIQMLRDKLNKL